MEFPKINVSSKADIQYITETWRKTLYDNLEQKYGKMDEKRVQQVQQILDKWLENMIKMSSANIDINGIPYDQALINDEFEPLDESLSKKLQDQQKIVEDLTLKVAERRKRVPEQVKMLLDDAIQRQSALADTIEFEPEDAQALEEEKARMEREFENTLLKRPELVAQEYTSSMALLSDLRKTVSSNITRLEGAQVVVDEVLP